MKTVVPSEDYEGARFAQWLQDNNYKFSHLSQNTFTRSWAVKAKLKRAGVQKGVPDYIICLKRKPLLCFIEMKRQTGGQVSSEQKDWIKALNEAGARALVCRGYEEAVKAINEAETCSTDPGQ